MPICSWPDVDGNQMEFDPEKLREIEFKGEGGGPAFDFNRKTIPLTFDGVENFKNDVREHFNRMSMWSDAKNTSLPKYYYEKDLEYESIGDLTCLLMIFSDLHRILGIEFNLSFSNFNDVDLCYLNLPNAYLFCANFQNTILCDSNFEGEFLVGVNFQHAILDHSNFNGAILTNANFQFAQCTGAEFQKAHLDCANFQGAVFCSTIFTGASFNEADFRGATLLNNDLRETAFQGANFQKIRLRFSNLANAKIFLIKADIGKPWLPPGFGWIPRILICSADRLIDLCSVNLKEPKSWKTRLQEKAFEILQDIHDSAKNFGFVYEYPHNYRGIQIDNAFGDDSFIRFAKDRSYIETFNAKHPRIAWLWKWSSDYGQSFWMVGYWATIVSILFGASFWLTDLIREGSFYINPLTGATKNFFTFIYFSIVTFTTFGFGDVTPTWWFPRLLVMGEVILGYITPGLLISILANKVARRA